MCLNNYITGKHYDTDIGLNSLIMSLNAKSGITCIGIIGVFFPYGIKKADAHACFFICPLYHSAMDPSSCLHTGFFHL